MLYSSFIVMTTISSHSVPIIWWDQDNAYRKTSGSDSMVGIAVNR